MKKELVINCIYEEINSGIRVESVSIDNAPPLVIALCLAKIIHEQSKVDAHFTENLTEFLKVFVELEKGHYGKRKH